MNYTIKKLPKSAVEITVTVSAAEFQDIQEKALRDLSEKVHLEGFRPGKAPLHLVKEKIGREEQMTASIEKAVQKYYGEIAEKEKLAIIGYPDAKVLRMEPELSFSITASVFPNVSLPDYAAIARKNLKEKKAADIEEKEVEEALRWLQNSRAMYITVPRALKRGDRAEIDFTVKNNGVIIDGGSSKNHPFIVGEGRFVAGFEDELLGMKEKETKEFQLTMPEKYPNNLGGKKLDFSVTVQLVQERILPELNDEFAKGVGKFNSVAELTKSVREGIMREKEEKERQRVNMTIAEEIAQKIAVDVPDALVDNEVEKMFLEFQKSIRGMGMEFEKYLEHIKKTADDLRKEWRKDAEKRVAIALILRAIAEKEKIEPTEEEILIRANKSLAEFKEDGQDVEKIDRMSLLEYSKSVLRNEKVFEFLESQA